MINVRIRHGEVLFIRKGFWPECETFTPSHLIIVRQRHSESLLPPALPLSLLCLSFFNRTTRESNRNRIHPHTLTRTRCQALALADMLLPVLSLSAQFRNPNKSFHEVVSVQLDQTSDWQPGLSLLCYTLTVFMPHGSHYNIHGAGVRA